MASTVRPSRSRPTMTLDRLSDLIEDAAFVLLVVCAAAAVAAIIVLALAL